MLKALLKNTLPPRLQLPLRAWDYRRNGPEEFRLLPRLCRRDRLSIDVGANIGVYTWEMRRHSARVVAYEPNPHLVERLRRSFGSGVTIIHAGLSASPGTATLRFPVRDGIEVHGLGSLVDPFDGDGEVRTYDVPLRRLDDEGHRDVGFIKIDVERHERAVIEGAMQLLSRERPDLLVEVAPLLYDVSLPEFFARVTELGYAGYFLFENRLERLENHDPARHNDMANVGQGQRFVTDVMLTARGSLP